MIGELMGKFLNAGVVKSGDIVIDKPWWLKKTTWAAIFGVAFTIGRAKWPEFFGRYDKDQLATMLVDTLAPLSILVAWIISQGKVDASVRAAALNREAAIALGARAPENPMTPPGPG